LDLQRIGKPARWFCKRAMELVAHRLVAALRLATEIEPQLCGEQRARLLGTAGVEVIHPCRQCATDRSLCICLLGDGRRSEERHRKSDRGPKSSKLPGDDHVLRCAAFEDAWQGKEF